MKKDKDELRRAILLLRFHTDQPTLEHPAYLPFGKIAMALGITYNQCHHICRRYLKRFTVQNV